MVAPMLKDVTIVIPVYCTTAKALDWLDECLLSAVSQGCNVVCWNDGSPTDVSIYLRKHDVFYGGSIHTGVSAARNNAVRLSKTALIYPLDCDDTLKPGAITQLLSMWDGTTPVYSDVAKFGLVDEPHYALLDFHCDHIRNHVGFSSVNVLHSKAQWEVLGGWNEQLDFYEDGEYNARLFARWCGKRCPQPLVNYRIHSNQRTKLYKDAAALYAQRILKFVRSIDMPCNSCGGKRRNPGTVSAFQASTPAAKVDPATLPGEIGGRVLCRYIGGSGLGRHYYQGPVTKFMYKVLFNDLVYADPADCRTEIEVMTKPNWYLVRITATVPAPAQTPMPVSAPAPQPVPAPVAAKPQRAPVSETKERKPRTIKKRR